MREYLYVLLALALLPLALLKDDRADARYDGTLRRYPEIEHKVHQLRKEGVEIPKSLIIDLLPERRIDGALLPRGTWTHWAYAASAAAAFFMLTLLLFGRGAAKPFDLVKVGLFTGTLGILFLLAVQFIAALTQGLWLHGSGFVTILFYIVKFIGFSYQSALDPESGFVFSFFGFTFGVGLCEELCKAFPLALHFRRTASLGWRGACLWGLASGVGFGISEGITYAADFYNGIHAGGVYIVRFLSCVALHAIWSAGVGITIWKRQEHLQGQMDFLELLWNLVKAVGVAMILHGLYDTLLKQEKNALALVVAAGSFAWLAWRIESARRWERTSEVLA